MNTQIIKFTVLAFVVFSMMFQSCKKNDDNESLVKTKRLSDSISITYGTSYNMSYGYGKNVTVLTRGFAERKLCSWDSVKFPTILCEQAFPDTSFENLLAEINKIDFSKLDSIYGCPDCCDGGAGLIIIRQPDFRYKVWLDLQLEEPKELQKLWKMLMGLNLSSCDSTMKTQVRYNALN